ncbi:NUDIX hydrolase [Streptococcus hongkongensis]|nr:hypothetical protein NC01_06880 [Streptococcus uberis]
MSKDFRIIESNSTMEVRATVLLVRDRKLFLVKKGDKYYTIGGALEFGETSLEAVSRETKEEVGIDVMNLQMAFIVENHFKINEKKWHNVEFHYIVNPTIDPPLQMNEPGMVLPCQWVPFEELESINLVPEFLKRELPIWNGQLKHIINKENK